MDNLMEQIVNISKASAYDILSPQVAEMQKEITELRSENAQLKIRLKGANQMLEVYKEFMNEVRPKDATVIQLGPDQNDLKDVNI